MPVRFHIHDTSYQLKNRRALRAWLLSIYTQYSSKTLDLSIVLCSDSFLLELNKDFLSHDYYTDILTFPIDEDDECLTAEVYISIDRIRENASRFESSICSELHRVMVHGVLHLAGFNDQTEIDRKRMRALETSALSELSI